MTGLVWSGLVRVHAHRLLVMLMMMMIMIIMVLVMVMVRMIHENLGQCGGGEKEGRECARVAAVLLFFFPLPQMGKPPIIKFRYEDPL